MKSLRFEHSRGAVCFPILESLSDSFSAKVSRVIARGIK